jgi:DNA-binding transcriptional LysR family regulator
VEPALITPDIHLIRSCCLAGLGIGLLPISSWRTDPGNPTDALVPVLPEALSEIPKLKQVLTHIRQFLAPL